MNKNKIASSTSTAPSPDPLTFDVVVVGSGGAGFAAAVTAANAGLSVLMVEKSPYLGGTTALSGGYMWMPLNRITMPDDAYDSREQVRLYLNSLAGDAVRPDMVEAFLENSPKLFNFLETRTEVRFLYGAHYVDYCSELPGAGKHSRTICPVAYDGRLLGDDIHLLRPPHECLIALGKDMMADLEDIPHFMQATRSVKSALYSLWRIMQYGRDRLLYGKGMRLAFGRALVARLIKSARKEGVQMWVNTPATGLIKKDGAVVGVTVTHEGKTVTLNARHGVVLASGGFGHDPELCAKYLPYPGQHLSATVPSNQGDAARMGMAAGADFQPAAYNNYAGCVLSVMQHPDGRVTQGLHSHSLGAPGSIVVNPEGKRYVNEALSYNMFMRAMCDAGAVHSYAIADHRHVMRFRFGQVKDYPPGLPRFLNKFVKSGHLIRANSLAELAEKIGVPGKNLEQTVSRFNSMAEAGKDVDFHRGEARYDLLALPPSKWPNRGLAPIDQPPYYAHRLEPGNLGTYAGLVTDAASRVLDKDGRPIDGLYASGLDMLSAFSGHYPGGGGSVGPAMTFGFIAARDIIARSGAAITQPSSNSQVQEAS